MENLVRRGKAIESARRRLGRRRGVGNRSRGRRSSKAEILGRIWIRRRRNRVSAEFGPHGVRFPWRRRRCNCTRGNRCGVTPGERFLFHDRVSIVSHRCGRVCAVIKNVMEWTRQHRRFVDIGHELFHLGGLLDRFALTLFTALIAFGRGSWPAFGRIGIVVGAAVMHALENPTALSVHCNRRRPIGISKRREHFRFEIQIDILGRQLVPI